MKTAVIIGAGPAGLTAAYELLCTTDIHPIVLESDEVIGGLSRTVEFAGNRMDIGGHRFFTKSPEVQALWHQLMPAASAPAWDDRVLGRTCRLDREGADPEQVDRVFLDRERISRIRYLKHFFDYPVSLNWQTISNLGLSRMAGIAGSYLYSSVHKRPERTLEDCMVNRFGRRLYETFFSGYTEKVWGRSPSQLGADWGSQRIKGVSLAVVLRDFMQRLFHRQPREVETSLIERFSYPKLGPGQFYECLREAVEARGGEIRMGCTAVSLVMAEDGHISQVDYVAPDGTRHSVRADYVLSSMPIKELCHALPGSWGNSSVRDIAASLPYRDFVTAGLLVKKLELHNETDYPTLGNIVPYCWIYIQEPDVKLGRLQVFNNWSPYLVRDPEHTVWLGLEYFCQEGDSLWNMSETDFLNFAAAELESIGVIRRNAVIEGHRVRMKKAYPAYYGSYRYISQVRAALDTISNLYCLGRNGQHRYNNMDHSMLTAIRAVDLIRQGISDKTTLWNVNTERDYQETTEKENAR